MSNAILTTLDTERLRAHYRDGFWRTDTIYSLVREHAGRAPERFAVRDRARRLTYAELLGAADRLAADLAARGVRPGQRVAVWLPSRVESAIALVACSRAGFVCCPSLHRDHTVADIVALLARTRAAALLAQPGYGADADRHDVFASLGALDALRHAYRVSPVEAGAPFADLPARAPAEAPTDNPDRVVYLAFTSGTTGQPKGVMHSDNTLLANARAIAGDWHIDAGSVIYSMSPLSHNLGLGALVMALAVGAELVVHDLARGASLLDRLVAAGATFLFGVPTHAIDLLAELRARGLTRLGGITGFRISGAAAPREVVAALLAIGVVPQSGYGMTETCSHQYTMPDDDPARIVETVGRACPGYEIRIWRQDDPDVEAPVGDVGLVGGRGASLMLGYFDDQDATEAAFNAHGWFMTGDLGWVDEAGYLRITGREKDVINRGGHKIHPGRLEALAQRHPAVARVAAFAVADARLGEKVCLAVMPAPGAGVDDAALLGHLEAAGLSKFDMPEYLLVVDEIPLTATGKILKRSLIEDVRAGRLQPRPVRRPTEGVA
jgi:acyl-CoA synthetase